MTLYKWHEAYQAALLEFQPEYLEKKIAAAELAITDRYQELAGDSDHSEERVHLNEAVKALRTLQVERMGYPVVHKSHETKS